MVSIFQQMKGAVVRELIIGCKILGDNLRVKINTSAPEEMPLAMHILILSNCYKRLQNKNTRI